jgi:hypothetical protein
MNPLERYLLWFAGGTVAALAIAWIAFQIQQQRFAPAVLFPLAVGAVFGGVLLLLNRAARLPNTLLLVVSAAVWALLLVVWQDYIGHRTRLSALDEQVATSHPLAAAMTSLPAMRPTFGEYLTARIRNQPIWWPVDALLVIAGACGVVTAAACQKRPAGGEPAEKSILENRGPESA